jgi:hypothetical protein
VRRKKRAGARAAAAATVVAAPAGTMAVFGGGKGAATRTSRVRRHIGSCVNRARAQTQFQAGNVAFRFKGDSQFSPSVFYCLARYVYVYAYVRACGDECRLLPTER